YDGRGRLRIVWPTKRSARSILHERRIKAGSAHSLSRRAGTAAHRIVANTRLVGTPADVGTRQRRCRQHSRKTRGDRWRRYPLLWRPVGRGAATVGGDAAGWTCAWRYHPGSAAKLA